MDLDSKFAKWALSEPKSGQVGTNGVWTHYRMAKMDVSSTLSTKSSGQVGRTAKEPEAPRMNISIETL